MPAYVVLTDPGGLPVDGVRNWSSGWLPAVYQGTPFRLRLGPGAEPGTTRGGDRGVASGAARLPRDAEPGAPAPPSGEFGAGGPDRQLRDGRPDANGRSRGARPLGRKPERPGTSTASTATRRGNTAPRCLLARRLVERGVRFVQLFLNGQPWDTHSKNAETLKGLCARTDRPSAALVQDLKQRGLLDSTIVLWTGEFGRLPISQGHRRPRPQPPRASHCGSPAADSRRATRTERPTSSATSPSPTSSPSTTSRPPCLDALGLDHRRLTYPHDGRDDSLTDADVTKARIIRELLA